MYSESYKTMLSFDAGIIQKQRVQTTARPTHRVLCHALRIISNDVHLGGKDSGRQRTVCFGGVDDVLHIAVHRRKVERGRGRADVSDDVPVGVVRGLVEHFSGVDEDVEQGVGRGGTQLPGESSAVRHAFFIGPS